MKVVKGNKSRANSNETDKRRFLTPANETGATIKPAKKGKTYTPAQQETLRLMELDWQINGAKYARESADLKREGEEFEQRKLQEQKERQKITPDIFKSSMEAEKYFGIEENCFNYLEKVNLHDGKMICPECNGEKIYRYTPRVTYRCKNDTCKKQFTCKTETIECPHCQCKEYIQHSTRIEFKCANDKCQNRFSCKTGMFRNTKVGLVRLFRIVLDENNSSAKKTMKEVATTIGVTMKTALALVCRVRHSALTQNFVTFDEDCEMATDTTSVYGKRENKPDNEKVSMDRIYEEAIQVLSLKQINGNGMLKLVPDLTIKSKKHEILKHAPNHCTFYSDEHGGFSFLRGAGYKHETVNHSLGEHGRGRVSNNAVESLHAKLKTALGAHYNRIRKNLAEFLNSIMWGLNAEVQKLTYCEKVLSSLQNGARVELPDTKQSGKGILRKMLGKVKTITAGGRHKAA